MAELWGLIHDAYGDELGLTSDDDKDYVNPSNMLDLDASENNSSSGSYNRQTAATVTYTSSRNQVGFNVNYALK